MKDLLGTCPICKSDAVLGYVCGDYFVHCTDDCPAPMCDHANTSTTKLAWQDWSKWYIEQQKREKNTITVPCENRGCPFGGGEISEILEKLIPEIESYMDLKSFEQATLRCAVESLRYPGKCELKNRTLTIGRLMNRTRPVWVDCSDDRFVDDGGYYALCNKGTIITPSGIAYGAEECLKLGWKFLDHEPTQRGDRKK